MSVDRVGDDDGGECCEGDREAEDTAHVGHRRTAE
jgi:hypothetical protein